MQSLAMAADAVATVTGGGWKATLEGGSGGTVASEKWCPSRALNTSAA